MDCHIRLDLDHLNVEARVDNTGHHRYLILDMKDGALAALRRALVTEVDGLLHDLRIAQ